MPYKVEIVQSEVNVTFKLGSFNFKKDQIITDEKLGAELCKSFPRIFKHVSNEIINTKPVIVEPPKSMFEQLVHKVEPVVEPPTPEVSVEETEPVIEEETEEADDVVEPTVEDETQPEPTGSLSTFKKRGRKKGK